MTRRVLRRRPIAAVLLAACLVALPAHAALFDDEEARRRIGETNQRLAQVQKQLEDRLTALEAQLKSQGLVEIFSQVEQLKSDVAKLRGQIEVLNHELEQAGKRQKDLYVDLDSRLRKLEGGPGASVSSTPPGSSGVASPTGTAAPAPTASVPAAGPGAAASPAAGPTGAAPDGGGEQRAYDGALEQFKAGNYAAAVTGFAAFVKTYPKSPLAPSAQYWIGNAQFAQKDYRAAIASQRQLVATYPESQKVPDALLNIATSQFELGDGAAARRTLESLIGKYPQSDAAVKARQRLAVR